MEPGAIGTRKITSTGKAALCPRCNKILTEFEENTARLDGSSMIARVKTNGEPVWLECPNNECDYQYPDENGEYHDEEPEIEQLAIAEGGKN